VISKRQKIVVGVSLGVLVLCSLSALFYARMYYDLAPMMIYDSSPEYATKLSDEERTHIYGLVRDLLFRVSVRFSVLAALWAAFACIAAWLWIKNSKHES